MLEKNEKKLIFDAHFHYFWCKKLNILDFPEGWSGISCAHTREEWEVQVEAPVGVIQAFGMHPQNAGNENILDSAYFMEHLIQTHQLRAIGEAGFDFYTEEYKENKNKQEEIWNIQLDLAIKYNLPIIIHCRKANDKLFEYAHKLKFLPEVLFHSYMGTPGEGKSLLNKEINGYFSFGKQIFNNNKKVISCIKELPYERVLGETDAPYQHLKGEKYTKPSEIINIIEGINNLSTSS